MSQVINLFYFNWECWETLQNDVTDYYDVRHVNLFSMNDVVNVLAISFKLQKKIKKIEPEMMREQV